MQLMDDLIHDLVTRLESRNQERGREGQVSLPHYSIKVLGQMSLLMDEEAMKCLPLAVTYDIDALLIAPRAANELRILLKSTLDSFGLEYDELSPEIWIPLRQRLLSTLMMR